MSKFLKALGMAFDENKAKPNLKMSVQRLRILINKKTNNVKRNKNEIALLLREGKEEKARIRVEQVIREENTIEAYEILDLHCELLAERIPYVVSEKECPEDLRECVCTLMWAANRSEVPELQVVKIQFGKKYGKEFVEMAEGNEGGCVTEKVVYKLRVDPPSASLTYKTLKAIADEYDIEYSTSYNIDSPSEILASPSGAVPTAMDYSEAYGETGGGGGGGGGASYNNGGHVWAPDEAGKIGYVAPRPAAGATGGQGPAHAQQQGHDSGYDAGGYGGQAGPLPPASAVNGGTGGPLTPSTPGIPVAEPVMPLQPQRTHSFSLHDIPSAPGVEEQLPSYHEAMGSEKGAAEAAAAAKAETPAAEAKPKNDGGASMDDLAARFAALHRK